MYMYQQYFGGIIWTNHAMDRLAQRRMPQDMAYETFKNPDSSSPGKQSHTTEFTKRYGPSLVTVIATQNEKKEWIILSCWIDPPLPGTMDSWKREEYKKYQKASGWGKFLIVLRQQLTLLFTGR